MYSHISFPGLGIGEFKLERIAFTIFGLEVSWYGIIIVAGIIAGFFYFRHRMIQLDATNDDVLDLSIYTLIFAVIGARLMYVVTNLSEFDSFLDAIAIWNGGIAIYGAIIAGGITAYFICRKKKLKYLRVFDCLSPAVMLGQIIGRWGNFVNGEAFGSLDSIEFFNKSFPTPWAENLPWRMELTDYSSSGAVFETGVFHPTFFYESLWNLIGFFIINSCFKKRKFRGQIFAMYIAWYGLGRFFIEALRTDSLRFSFIAPLAGVKVSQLIALICLFAGAFMLLHGFSRAKEKNSHSKTVPLLMHNNAAKEPEQLTGHTERLNLTVDDSLILFKHSDKHTEHTPHLHTGKHGKDSKIIMTDYDEKPKEEEHNNGDNN